MIDHFRHCHILGTVTFSKLSHSRHCHILDSNMLVKKCLLWGFIYKVYVHSTDNKVIIIITREEHE